MATMLPGLPTQMTISWPAAAVANLTVLAMVGLAAILHRFHTDAYYRAVQEDQALEWATFWAFALAASAFTVAASRQYRTSSRIPWFSLGLSLFCIFVALEEISWGQRVLGYRPPDYFLEQNFQQELNVHNVFGTSLRKLVLKGVILGFGVWLPLLGVVPRAKDLLARLGILVPPWQLAPAFLGIYLLYEIYPWSHTGEWVELLLGVGFLLAAVIAALETRSASDIDPGALEKLLAVSVLAVGILGLTTASLSNLARMEDPELIAAAVVEVDALKSDFLGGQVDSRCSLHKRLYSFMEKYEQYDLLDGDFAKLATRGLPQTRAEFLLDPWNSPYWIRDLCENSRRVTFVYSFGPDRARDSTRLQVLGDDIGAYIRQ